MGRQAFRRSKSDGTIDDGTGGSVPFSTGLIDSENTFLLVNDNIWALHSDPIFGVQVSGQGTYGYDDSHYYVTLWPFIAPKSGNLSSMTITINQSNTTNSDVMVGIYDCENGYFNDLLGVATWPASTINSTGNKEQTSFTTNTGGSSTTITLVEGNKYFYGIKRDNADTTSIKYKTCQNNTGYTINKSSIGNHGASGYMCFHNHASELFASETNAGWVQHAGRNRLYCWIKY